MKVYLLTAGKFSGVFTSKELAKDAAKQIAVKHRVRLKARIEEYPVNESIENFIYHTRST